MPTRLLLRQLIAATAALPAMTCHLQDVLQKLPVPLFPFHRAGNGRSVSYYFPYASVWERVIKFSFAFCRHRYFWFFATASSLKESSAAMSLNDFFRK